MTKEKETEAVTTATEKIVFTNAHAVDLLNTLDYILAKTSDLSVQASYGIQKNIDKLTSIVKKLQSDSKKLVEKHVKLGEKGEVLFTSLSEEDAKDPQKAATFRPQYIYASDEDKKACEDALMAYMNTELNIEFYRIPLSCIAGSKIDTRGIGKAYGLFVQNIINENF